MVLKRTGRSGLTRRNPLALALALVIALAIALVGCACDNGTEAADSAAIRDTIYGYVDAYNAEDYQLCLTYLTGWDPSSSEDDQISLMQVARGTTGRMTIESIENISISGSTATATVTSSWENPDAEGRTTNAPGVKVTLRKDGGTWKHVV